MKSINEIIRQQAFVEATSEHIRVARTMRILTEVFASSFMAILFIKLFLNHVKINWKNVKTSYKCYPNSLFRSLSFARERWLVKIRHDYVYVLEKVLNICGLVCSLRADT